MKVFFTSLAIAALLGVLLFGCMRDEPIQAPEQTSTLLPNDPSFSIAIATETLSDIDIPLAAGTGIKTGAVGLVGDPALVQPGTINIDVPGTVKQVILYWEGQNATSGGDDDIIVNGNTVLGTLIGGPTLFYPIAYSSSYRADITGLGLVSAGANTLTIEGMEFTKIRSGSTYINDGAGVVVIYDDGSDTADIRIRDGNDCCFYDFADPLDRTEPQTYTFAPSISPRTAKLVLMAASVMNNRPNLVRVTVDGVITKYVDIFNDLDGPEFDTAPIFVDIPAGVTSLTVQCFSEKDPSSVLTGIPASLTWIVSALALPPPELPRASLGDFVWEDVNENGIQDPGEPGIPDVTVHLYQGCSASDPMASTTTDGSGLYLFSDLEPGDYFVKFDLPTGYAFSPQDQGADDAKDSDADPSTGRTICTTLDPDENDMTWDAGMYELHASLGDFVWEDVNENGIQDPGEPGIPDVTVHLYQGCSASDPMASTTTDGSGLYLFSDLEPGDYFVKFDLPTGYAFSPQDQGADDAKDSDADPSTGRTICTTLDPDENDMTWDAGMYELPASLGDFVWDDLDEDGIQDPGEPGIPGVTVYLYQSCVAASPLTFTTTDSNGEYLFADLEAGDYFVKFDLPAGYTFSPKDQGANDAVDSDANPSTGKTVCTTLDPGEDDMTWDAGMHVILQPMGCRVTGGGVDRSGDWDGITYAQKENNSNTDNRYQFGGQAGANTALPPQPKGEWTHHQQRGPYGSFTFHAGTASAPEGTEIAEIVCNDPDNCRPARKAPAKQIDFWGVGTFKSVKHVPDIIKDNVIVGESLHWFEVNIDDLGEPGKGGKQDPPLQTCPAEGFGLHGVPGDGDAKCECPDYYRITIYAGPTDASEIIYMVEGYIDGGNLQIHPLTGYDREPDAGDLGTR